MKKGLENQVFFVYLHHKENKQIKIMNEVVKFVSAKPYLNCSDKVFNEIFFCLHGRKEVVILCSESLKNTLRNLPSNYLQPRLIDIKKYLDSNNIKYVENFSNTPLTYV